MLKILVNTLTTLTLSMVSHFGGFFVSKNLNAFFLVLGRQYPVDIHSCPIYANLPSEMETKIFEPTPEGCACDQYCRNVYHDRWRGFCHGSWVFQAKFLQPQNWNVIDVISYCGSCGCLLPVFCQCSFFSISF